MGPRWACLTAYFGNQRLGRNGHSFLPPLMVQWIPHFSLEMGTPRAVEIKPDQTHRGMTEWDQDGRVWPPTLAIKGLEGTTTALCRREWYSAPYVDEEHANHLLSILLRHYDMETD